MLGIEKLAGSARGEHIGASDGAELERLTHNLGNQPNRKLFGTLYFDMNTFVFTKKTHITRCYVFVFREWFS